MNILNTSMTKNTFKEWFAKIDQDGSDSISLPELILALCGIMKVEVPADAKENDDLPAKLLLKNRRITHEMKKMTQNPAALQRKETLKFSHSMKQVLSECSTEQVMAHIRQIWQCYDKDGHGYMSKLEAKHFCARYFKNKDQGLS